MTMPLPSTIPPGNLLQQTGSAAFPPGSHEEIDQAIAWHYRFHVNGSLEGTRFVWQDAGDHILKSGIDSFHLQVDTMASTVMVSAVLKLEDYYNDTVPFQKVPPGIHNNTTEQKLSTYDHAWTGQVTSNLSGKTIADGKQHKEARQEQEKHATIQYIPKQADQHQTQPHTQS